MSQNTQLRTLVVDDSPSSLRATSEVLQAAGFDVQTACEGEEAVSMVQQILPDVVVLDIILPKKTGFQVCREIKTDPATRHVPVVLLSSKSQEADRFWGQRQGADAYLTKPVDPAELVAIVRAVGAGPCADLESTQG
ncbi:MAG: response regulator [Planctomycetales bacterium]|nr:response regulator [Planctomycetales bacterium]